VQSFSIPKSLNWHIQRVGKGIIKEKQKIRRENKRKRERGKEESKGVLD
jgi:hypothetical protein